MKKISILAALALSMIMCYTLSAQNPESVKMTTLSGETTTAGQWADGKTPYVVSFWFVTCKYCIEEMDAITEMYEDWQEEAPFRFYAVNTDDTRSLAKAKAMARGRGWDNFLFAFDTNKEYTRAMNVVSMPHVFLYDKNGKLVYSHVGYSPGDEQELFRKIKALK
ncbi:MAG: TlpA family protein disulfide reductase [Bacteroidales bacterium]|jgi:thiol-disulfide isomerase/thioredoxin|nr:TlpA family protein disulfide reductase [Bacteroidales bacterium]MBQ6579165.1 TlpA family protein disulfide reductase [Bacteroidales bacterium]